GFRAKRQRRDVLKVVAPAPEEQRAEVPRRGERGHHRGKRNREAAREAGNAGDPHTPPAMPDERRRPHEKRNAALILEQRRRSRAHAGDGGEETRAGGIVLPSASD